MSETGIIILVHGSRGERAKAEIPEVWAKLTRGLQAQLHQKLEITGAALQFNTPTLEEAAELQILRGVGQIIIVPYFLFFGRHLTEDIPGIIGLLKKRHPQVSFTMTENLGMEEYFVQVLARRILEVCPGLSSDADFYANSPEMIEKHSMEIVESLLPEDLTGDERTVTRRLVHASGDPSISRLVKFSPSAVSSGMAAIRGHHPIYADVRMVAAGINSGLAQQHGCAVVCALQAAGPATSETEIGTRSSRAVRQLGAKLNNAVVAIGNAPTALLALIEMTDKEQIVPALVVGMPVGFVQAAESKAELMKRDIPYITIEGTRGGSPMAAAAVNALLKLA